MPKNLYDANDLDIGRMDTPELAALVVSEMNGTAQAKLLVATAIWPLQAFQQLVRDGAAVAGNPDHRGPFTEVLERWFAQLPVLVSPDAKPRPPELLLADVARIAFTEASDPAAALDRIRKLLG